MVVNSLLFADLDNTLYNWIDFYGPSFRGMVHALSKKMALDEEILYDEFRTVYQKRQDLEYSFALQEMEITKDLSDEELEDLISLARTVFNQVRLKNLSLYAGVKDTLRWANDAGVYIIGITNAPFYHAEKRIKSLGIAKFISGLAGKASSIVPEDLYTTRKIKISSERGKQFSVITNRWNLELHELKPSPSGLMRILDELNFRNVEHKYIVGDSLESDVAPATHIGAKGIWARYGRTHNPKNMETLLRITPWSDEKIEKEKDKKAIKPDFIIDSFSEIRNIVITPQYKLPGFN